LNITARVHPHWAGGKAGYLYSVIYGGTLLVERSRDPECDAARALVAKGITGTLTLLDGKTGLPRLTLDIEKAAKLTVREDRGLGPLFVRYVPWSEKVKERVETASEAA
jgi:hypothetical protein